MPSLKKSFRRALVRLVGYGLFPFMGNWKQSDLYDFPNPPVKPCHSCTGNSAIAKGRDPETGEILYETSWEFCQAVKTCAATIDWDEVYGHGGSA
jgi:hypothetical protein